MTTAVHRSTIDDGPLAADVQFHAADRNNSTPLTTSEDDHLTTGAETINHRSVDDRTPTITARIDTDYTTARTPTTTRTHDADAGDT